jgi:hypothetical protein
VARLARHLSDSNRVSTLFDQGKFTLGESATPECVSRLRSHSLYFALLH